MSLGWGAPKTSCFVAHLRSLNRAATKSARWTVAPDKGLDLPRQIMGLLPHKPPQNPRKETVLGK